MLKSFAALPVVLVLLLGVVLAQNVAKDFTPLPKRAAWTTSRVTGSPEPPLPSAPAIPPPPSNSLVDSIDLETPLTDIPESPSIPVAPDTKLTEETVPKSLEEIEKALKEVVPAAGETTEPAEPDPAP